ncbi:hypothetical protein [Thermomonospora cellulosilytica]|uniref:Putative coiled-coil protein SlyX n=1 Tax=Thermomonospora cellulosilytica TaxID=1411118 RepID=A0A7W3MTT6_9ACTN|nr:hypothetical protein [Thermomonospora cellulosilytica]MBA9001778.1 putative coiled-coil protein SlyX [Thermomonospora cellulosilytica]
MTTVVLILLCLAIAGRELYLAFDRRRPVTDPVAAAEIAALRGRVAELEAALERPAPAPAPVDVEPVERRLAEAEAALRAADARITSLVEQVNERLVPEVNDRLAEQRDLADRLAADVARLRRQVRRRLEDAVAASLGAGPAEPVNMVHGLVGGRVPADRRPPLTEAYEGCAAAFGLQVELAEPGGERRWHTRYFLSGAGPRELERDFLGMLCELREGAPQRRAVRALLTGLHGVQEGVAQIGPLYVVRLPQVLLCGVPPLAELLRREQPAAAVRDPRAVADRLRELPQDRLCDLSDWRPRPLGA